MNLSAKTDVGVMRSVNQDFFVTGELPYGCFFAVVCDGMGGHAGGDVASRAAAERISAEIRENFREDMSSASVKNILEAAFVLANLDVFDMAQENEELRDMGTTAVAAVFGQGLCVVANVGDSRCYHISKNGTALITHDHSLVQQMVDAGIITKEESVSHPRKNIITRALGISEDVDADFFDVDFNDGDRLLLCTDGLSNLVSEKDIYECITADGFDDCSQRLISLANKNGGNDNITAVVIGG